MKFKFQTTFSFHLKVAKVNSLVPMADVYLAIGHVMRRRIAPMAVMRSIVLDVSI